MDNFYIAFCCVFEFDIRGGEVVGQNRVVMVLGNDAANTAHLDRRDRKCRQSARKKQLKGSLVGEPAVAKGNN